MVGFQSSALPEFESSAVVLKQDSIEPQGSVSQFQGFGG